MMHRCALCHLRLEGAAPCRRDGWTPPPGGRASTRGPASAAPRVEGLTLSRRIGRGGFADVWAARRDLDGAPAAVKVGHAATPLSRERFRREADALERVGAPHAARLDGRGVLAEGHPYLVMERLVGRTLAAELAALAAPPGPERVVRRAAAILVALEAAHARGVVHGDLKPENLFLRRPGERVVLIDFGLSTCAAAPERGAGADAPRTRAGAVAGTPEYMAPEQLRGGPSVGAAADLYAFGVILFELLTLQPPFTGDASAIEHGHLALRPPRPGDLAPVPAALEEIALACLAKDPRRRPVSAAALRRALRDVWAGGTPASAPRSSSRGPGEAALVGEGSHPVALLVADIDGASAPVIAAIVGQRGILARQRGRRYVGVFPGRDVDDPAQAALAAARELVDRPGARAAVHLGRVLLRPGGAVHGAPAVYGGPVERPETWTPPEPWSGLALTEDFKRALPEEEGAPVPSSRGARGEVDEPPLLGRDDALAPLAARAAAAVDGTCPGLVSVIGEPGLGKTRLAAEAARLAAAAYAGAWVISLRAARPGDGGAAWVIRALLCGVLDAPGGAPPDPRAFCEARLGEALGAAAWPAVAAALGWTAAPADRASGRRGLAQVLAEGLRRRARRGPVAVILDDAHQAEDVLLDALELATLDGDGVKLWAVITAGPRFEASRRGWGLRSQRHDRIALAPLDEAPAMELAARLLLPAEHPPAETLRRLHAWAGGNPGCLRELIRSLKRAGVVRRRAGGAHYVATAEIDALPPSPAWQWLAARQLDELPPELSACVRVCAALGVSFRRAELERVLDRVDRAGGAGTPIDAGFGIDALVARGILRRAGGDRCSFRSAALAEAVHDLLDPAHREPIHRHALELWREAALAEGDAPEALEALEAIARHAAACGERAEAAAALLRLGDLALAGHRHVEADQRYTAALGVAAEGDALCSERARERARALAGRGLCRYRAHRVREAREDFAGGLALARALGDAPLAATLLLEDATALDWAFEFDESARRVEEARRIIAGLCSPGLALRLRIADGRTAWRQGQTEASLRILGECVERAASSGDGEASLMALMILPFELACAGRLEEAEARFDEVIALVTASGDLFHLCGVYINRIALWIGRWSLPGAVGDLRRAVDLAREIGNPWLEKLASYNVALLLHWSDRQPEALALARRARLLEERSRERPVAYTALLLAEILIALDQHDEAAPLVSWVEQTCPPEPADLPRYHMLQLVLREAGAAVTGATPPPWDEVLRRAEGQLSVETALRLLYWRACLAVRGGRLEEAALALEAARARRGPCPLWLSRFDALEREAGQLGSRLTARQDPLAGRALVPPGGGGENP